MVPADAASQPQHLAPMGRPGPFDTRMSGHRREVRGGAIQAHLCAVSSVDDVREVMERFTQSERFAGVVSWSYAYRLRLPSATSHEGAGGPAMPGGFKEEAEDGLDEGCGDKLMVVLRRFSLHGLLLVVSRWQDYGVTNGLELFGIELYSFVTERAKDVISELRRCTGPSTANTAAQVTLRKPRTGPQVHDFSGLPKLTVPRAPSPYAPSHFMAESPMRRSVSLPGVSGGGDSAGYQTYHPRRSVSLLASGGFGAGRAAKQRALLTS